MKITPKKKEFIGELSSLKNYRYAASAFTMYLDNDRIDIQEMFAEFVNRTVKITIEVIESEDK